MTRDRVRGEVGLGGRTPSVSAQFWKDAGIGGQQVIEAIIVSSAPLSAADAESHRRDLVRVVVVLREPEKSL